MSEITTDNIIAYGWIVTLVVCGIVVSWAIILLQAIFSDIRIAMVGLFGGLAASLAMLFSAFISELFLAIACVVNVAFVGIYLFKNIKSPVVYISSSVFVFCAIVGGWLYLSL